MKRKSVDMLLKKNTNASNAVKSTLVADKGKESQKAQWTRTSASASAENVEIQGFAGMLYKIICYVKPFTFHAGLYKPENPRLTSINFDVKIRLSDPTPKQPSESMRKPPRSCRNP